MMQTDGYPTELPSASMADLKPRLPWVKQKPIGILQMDLYTTPTIDLPLKLNSLFGRHLAAGGVAANLEEANEIN